MARLDFDFLAAKRPVSRLGLALLVTGAGALAWSALAWQQARDRQAGLARQLAALEAPASRPVARTRPADQSATETRARLAAQLRYRWQPAFEALSAAHDSTVALTALDANQARARIRLTAETRTFDHALAWIARLQAQPAVRRVVLVQHQILADADQSPMQVVVDLEFAP